MEEKHLKVAWTHVYLTVAYGIVALFLGLLPFLKGRPNNLWSPVATALLFCIPVVFHLLLARDTANDSTWQMLKAQAQSSSDKADDTE